MKLQLLERLTQLTGHAIFPLFPLMIEPTLVVFFVLAGTLHVDGDNQILMQGHDQPIDLYH